MTTNNVSCRRVLFLIPVGEVLYTILKSFLRSKLNIGSLKTRREIIRRAWR